MKVISLIIYPIKSMGGFSVNSMELSFKGPLYDRQFMLIDNNGKFLSQRELPLMTQFRTNIKNEELIVSFRNESIRLKITDKGTKDCNTKVWRQEVKAKQFCDETNVWFSDRLGTDCRLVSLSEESPRIRSFNKSPYKSVVSFADGYPYLIIGSKSLDTLNERLQTPIGMDRMRPNIVIETTEPHIEDIWNEINIGKTKFKVIKPCARCVMTTIDQDTGKKGLEPLNTLSQYRKFGRNILFGVNSVLLKGARIRIGDKIEIIDQIER